MASPPRRPRLTPLQKAFVQEFVSNPDPTIRNHATAAYKAAGGRWTTEGAARATACGLLTKPNVQHAIQVAHTQAEAELLIRLRDWKLAAIEAQPILLNLARGLMPDGRRIETVGDAAVGHLMLGALKEILDRVYPKSLYIKIDTRQSLARLLGVPLERLPDKIWTEEEDR
jgi:hypothetical protein